VKILFIARHFSYFRNFDSAIALLAERGHAIHLAADRDDALGGRELVDRLAARHPGVTVGLTPIRDVGRYTRVAKALRLGLDYLRYSGVDYDTMPRLRQRAYDRTPAFVLALARLPYRRFVTWLIGRVEQAVPRPRPVDEFMQIHRPGLLLVTPLIELGSPQLDYIRAARRLGIRSALCVWSWDHLSSKALIRERPDDLIVWNEVQREEALRFHGVPAGRVHVTGAQCFDRWFDRPPSRDRMSFCRRAGLPDDKPFILYVGSALFRGSPPEAAYVREWVQDVRHERSLRDFNILIRPHPQRLEEWPDPVVEGASVWGSMAIDEDGRADYFDSLHYSAAVVGLNTSALVEAAIVDRPVFTILEPKFRDNQEGTFHFHHLLTVGNGFLQTARTLDEHVEQLGAALAGRVRASNRAFVERFIRPHGLTSPATPVFADTVEQLARTPAAAAQAPSAWLLLLRPVVYALVLAGRLPLLERIYWNPAKVRLHGSGLSAQTS
jgi:hypothetical protein